MDMVRSQDRARYLTTLYAPQILRPKLWALHAFNIELARVREQVSEPVLGEIRLAWWRGAVDGVYGGVARAHPVIAAMLLLPDAVPQSLLDEMIDGRLTDVSDGALADLGALNDYAQQTGGAQNVAAAYVLGVTNEVTLGAVRDVGTAWSLTGILRAVQFQARLGKVFLPDAELAALGLSRHDIAQRPVGEGIIPVVRKIADRAAGLLTRVTGVEKPDRSRAGPCLMLATLARDYLLQLVEADHDVTRTDFARGDLRRQAKLLWAALTHRF
jgi:NADH dehydrogenase [ubiquinone] 1 alpha subcomplex assembly factor 6